MSSKTYRATNALKSGVVYGGSAVLNTINYFTPHLAGAVDIVVVEQPDGTFKSTPFYVRFGKYTQYRNKDKVVRLYVNGQLADFQMYLGTYGQAFFAVETKQCESDDEEQNILNGMMSPASGYSSGDDAPFASAEILGAVQQEVDTFKMQGSHDGGEAGAAGLSPPASHAAVLRNHTFPPPHEHDPEAISREVSMRGLYCRDGSIPRSSSPRSGQALGLEPVFESRDNAGHDDTNTLGSPSYCWDDSAHPGKGREAAALHTHWEREGGPESGGEGGPTVQIGFPDAPANAPIPIPSLRSAPSSSAPQQGNPPSLLSSSLKNTAQLSLGPPSPLESVGQSPPGTPRSPAQPLSDARSREAREADDADNEALMGASPTLGIYGVSPSDTGYMADVDVASSSNVAGTRTGGWGFGRGRRAAGGSGALLDLQRLELSLCGQLLKRDMSYTEAQQVFESQKVPAEVFAARGSELLASSDLVCRIGGVMYAWRDAAPMIVGMLAFGVKWENLVSAGAPSWKVDGEALQQSIRAGARSSRRRWLWPFSGWSGGAAPSPRDSKAAAGAPSGTSPPETRRLVAIQSEPAAVINPAGAHHPLRHAESAMEEPLSLPSLGLPRLSRQHTMKKTLTPSSEQLASLRLNYGQNIIHFRTGVSTELRAYLWLVKWNTRIVISDIDGTITKSDILGHVLPAIGMDWSHAGITRLFSNIRTNGYMMMYLSSRSISQANITRDFIHKLVQGGTQMPVGPVIISPHGLLPSLYREMILRRPHEFKIACLQEIRALFPPDWSPFYSGFGNRETDVISYKEVGVPLHRIFTINPRGEIRKASLALPSSTWASLQAINQLVHEVFPPLDHIHALEDTQCEAFNDLNYWGSSNSYPIDVEALERQALMERATTTSTGAGASKVSRANDALLSPRNSSSGSTAAAAPPQRPAGLRAAHSTGELQSLEHSGSRATMEDFSSRTMPHFDSPHTHPDASTTATAATTTTTSAPGPAATTGTTATTGDSTAAKGVDVVDGEAEGKAAATTGAVAGLESAPSLSSMESDSDRRQREFLRNYNPWSL